MPDLRSVDCEVWAKREIERLSTTLVAQLLEIRPKPPNVVLGGVRLPPAGQMCWPHPPWHYHFAIVAGGLVRDEFYPNGIPMGEYRQNCEHQEAIDFVLRRP